MTNLGKATLKVGLTVGFTLGAIVGLVGCADETEDGLQGTHDLAVEGTNGFSGSNGLVATNGFNGANGFNGVNGFNGSNGFFGVNGLNATNGFYGANGLTATNGFMGVNGLSATNGLNATNGLSATNGMITTDNGRKAIAYLTKCALPAGHVITKGSYSFQGGYGLCPEWEYRGVDGSNNQYAQSDRTCQNLVSACLLAHINTSGVHVPLWMDSESGKVGWGTSPNYPKQEGTFFGNIIYTGALPQNFGMPSINAPAAFFCEGADITAGVVAGRIGSTQAGAPYMNPFGANVKCSNGQTAAGPTSYGMSAPDGYKQACAGGYCFQNGEPITVWRNPNYTPVFDAVYRYGLSPMNSGKSLDVCNGNANTTNGTCVQQYSTWGGDPQRFAILKSGSNWMVAMKANTNKCLGLVGNATGDGTRIEVQDCNYGNNQAWSITADANTGAFVLKNVGAGRCLNVAGGGTGDGNPMEIWSCQGYSSQKFKLTSMY